MLESHKETKDKVVSDVKEKSPSPMDTKESLTFGEVLANQKFAPFVRPHACAKSSVKTECALDEAKESSAPTSYLGAILGKKTPRSSVSLIRHGGIFKFRMQKRNLKVLNMLVTDNEIEICIGDEENVEDC